jgi:glycosyltransferase involved in cell wall biosynthesis
MVFCPLISGLLFAALRKLFYRDPLWVNIQDVPVEAAASSGIIRSPWVTRMAMVMQKLLFDRADVWTTISPEMVDQVARFKPPGKPLYFCPNWLTGALGRQIQELPPPLERRRTSRVNLVYCGTIGKKQGLLELCQALGGSTADFRLQIYGDGSEAGAVRRWVESARDERFGFAGLLPTSEFVAEIRRADWFVVPQKSDVGGAFLPSKLLPAISIGTPILAVSAERGPLFAEVTRYGLGQVVSWAQVGELAAHWARIAPDSAAYSELQRNCLRRARDFDRSAAIDRMESLLRSHVGGSSIELASDPKQAGASPAECDVGART